MKIHLFAFGRIKNAGLGQAIQYYEKLLRPWAKVEVHELSPEKVTEKTKSVIESIHEKEEMTLLKAIQKHTSSLTKIILLDESGSAQATRKWAAFIENCQLEGVHHLIFCLGSSVGFSHRLKENASEIFSFGPQTFSHELARVVFFEQIYRAFSVLKNHPYHN